MFFCASAILMAGCTSPVDIGRVSGDSEDGMTEGIDSGSVKVPVEESDLTGDGDVVISIEKYPWLYVSGVRFPDGHDWQGDLGSDAGGGVLFLMRDSEVIAEVDIGDGNCVSVDADMHRIIDGHLYTDYSTASETVVKEDGVELFRFSGREMVRSMYVKDGRVYTLGVPRSGSGWTFRRDGTEILSREGELVGGLYEDGGSLFFSYADPGGMMFGNTYYVVRDGTPIELDIDGDRMYLSDIRVIDGEPEYVYSLSGSTGKYFHTADGDGQLSKSVNAPTFGDAWICYDGEDRFVWGSLDASMGLWRGYDREECVTGKIMAVSVHAGDYIFVSADSSGNPTGINRDGEVSAWPDGYDFIYDGCTATNTSHRAVGMVDRSYGNRPTMWLDGEITEFDFNGYFTQFDYQRD